MRHLVGRGRGRGRRMGVGVEGEWAFLVREGRNGKVWGGCEIFTGESA